MHYRFLNDFYSNDYDLLGISSFKIPSFKKSPGNAPSIQSPFLPALKKNHLPLTLVKEEDFFVDKRANRKRDSILATPHSEIFQKRLSVKKPSFHKNANSLISLTKFPSFLNDRNPNTKNQSIDTYKHLLERIKRFDVKKNDSQDFPRQELLTIVENLIENSNDYKKGNVRARTVRSSTTQFGIFDSEASFSGKIIPSHVKLQQESKKNLSEFHLPTSYSTIKYQNFSNSKEVNIFKKNKSGFQSSILRKARRGSNLNFSLRSHFLGGIQLNENRCKIRDNLTFLGNEGKTEKGKLRDIINKIHRNN